MDGEQTLITESMNGVYMTQVLYIMMGPLVLEVYFHDVASYPVPVAS